MWVLMVAAGRFPRIALETGCSGECRHSWNREVIQATEDRVRWTTIGVVWENQDTHATAWGGRADVSDSVSAALLLASTGQQEHRTQKLWSSQSVMEGRVGFCPGWQSCRLGTAVFSRTLKKKTYCNITQLIRFLTNVSLRTWNWYFFKVHPSDVWFSAEWSWRMKGRTSDKPACLILHPLKMSCFRW